MKHLMVFTFSFLASFALAQTEINLKKFRLKPGTSQDFERMVLEFSGPSVDEEVKVKKVSSAVEQDVSIQVSNVQWMGAIPESQMNETFENKRQFMGPLVINTDIPQNGFTLRLLVKNPDHEVDAFWLSKPTRLVVDVFPKSSPRMANRSFVPSLRKTASMPALKTPKVRSQKALMAVETKGEPKPEIKPESIFCFLSKAQMSPSVAYEPWRGSSSSIPLEVRNPSAAEGEQKEGIVCFPATSRVHPQLNFDKAENPLSSPMTEPRNPASESKPRAFNPLTSEKETVPPSLGANFEKTIKRANPAILLPPYR